MCIETFNQMLSSATIDELNTMLDTVKHEIANRQPRPKDLVELIPDFCTDKDFMKSLWDECESLGLMSSRNKVATQWLSPSSEPYIYNDVNPVHEAKNINKYPNISKMLSFVNASDVVDGPLDACLVLKYPSPSAVLRPHADDEKHIIDQSKSICPFSLGTSRTLEFFTKGKKSKRALGFRLEEGSLLVMKPGTQQTLDHCVRSESISVPSVSPSEDVMYCLSFRAIVKGSNTKPSTKPVAVPEPAIEPAHQPVPEPSSEAASLPEMIEKPTSPKRHVCLIAGDSFAERLEHGKLGRNKAKVEKIAVGCSRIKDVEIQIVQYSEKNLNVIVDKLIISVGTNDIRYCNNGVEHLKGPLKKLCNTI